MEALRPPAARLVLHGDLVAHGAAPAAVRGHPAGRGRAQRAAVRLLRVRPPHERSQPRILNSLQRHNMYIYQREKSNVSDHVMLNDLDPFYHMVP